MRVEIQETSTCRLNNNFGFSSVLIEFETLDTVQSINLKFRN